MKDQIYQKQVPQEWATKENLFQRKSVYIWLNSYHVNLLEVDMWTQGQLLVQLAKEHSFSFLWLFCFMYKYTCMCKISLKVFFNSNSLTNASFVKKSLWIWEQSIFSSLAFNIFAQMPTIILSTRSSPTIVKRLAQLAM